MTMGLFLPDADATLRKPSSGDATLVADVPAARNPLPSKLPISAALAAKGDRRSIVLPDADKTLRRYSGIYGDLKNRCLTKSRRSWSLPQVSHFPLSDKSLAAGGGVSTATPQADVSRSPQSASVMEAAGEPTVVTLHTSPASADDSSGNAALPSAVRSQSVSSAQSAQPAGRSRVHVTRGANMAGHPPPTRSPSAPSKLARRSLTKFSSVPAAAFEGRSEAVETKPACDDSNVTRRKPTSKHAVNPATRSTPSRGVTTRGREAAAASSTKQRRLPSLGGGASSKSPVLGTAKNTARAPTPPHSRQTAKRPVIDAQAVRKPSASKTAAPEGLRHVAAKGVDVTLRKGVLPSFTREATFTRD